MGTQYFTWGWKRKATKAAERKGRENALEVVALSKVEKEQGGILVESKDLRMDMSFQKIKRVFPPLLSSSDPASVYYMSHATSACAGL